MAVNFKVGEISFMWYAMIGCLVTMGVGWVTSQFMTPPPPEKIKGLTYDPQRIKEKLHA